MDKSDTFSKKHRKIPSDKKGFRSLICDESGIIIGEMVYRCLICSYINESMDKVRAHYQSEHDNIEDISNGELSYINGDYSPPPCDSYDSAQSVPAEEEHEDTPRVTNSNSTSCGVKNRSGYITCSVCSSIRFYAYVQRRYGQYTCSPCYRHFREFLIKPKIYTCPNLALCPVDIKNKCRACWLLKCINVYGPNVDEDKQEIMENYRPRKKQEYEGEDKDKEDDEDKEDEKEEKTDNDEIIKEMSPTDAMEEDGSNPETDQEDKTDTGSSKNSKKATSRRRRNWSCKKCTNCLKEECGKCIYCLDRPKFGGSFRLRQRCANRRCLLKLNNV